ELSHRSLCESYFLGGPIEREIQPPFQLLGAEADWLLSLDNRFDDFGRQKREWDQPAHVAVIDALACRDLLGEDCSAARQLGEPTAPARDRLQQRWVGKRRPRDSFDHQPQLNSTPLHGDRYRAGHLDRSLARLIDQPA